MKTKIIQYIKAIILVLSLTLGMGYVLANFTPPHSTPTTCITDPTNPNYDPGCLAPINVGGLTGSPATDAQTKTGDLTLTGILTSLHLLTSDLTVTNPGASPTPITAGQVLTAADSTGKVVWGGVSGGSGGAGTMTVSGNTDIATGVQGTWSDMDGLQMTLQNTGAGTTKYVFTLNAPIRKQGYIQIQLVKDGSTIVGISPKMDLDSGVSSVSYGVVAGGAPVNLVFTDSLSDTNAHVYKIQWQHSSGIADGTSYQDGANYPRYLTATWGVASAGGGGGASWVSVPQESSAPYANYNPSCQYRFTLTNTDSSASYTGTYVTDYANFVSSTSIGLAAADSVIYVPYDHKAQYWYNGSAWNSGSISVSSIQKLCQ